MKCKNCDSLLKENDIFCTNCGVKVEEAPKEETSIVEDVKEEVEILKDETNQTEEIKEESVNQISEIKEEVNHQEENISEPAKPIKQKNKKIIIIAVILIIIASIIGLAYFYEFKTSNLRVNSFLNEVFSFTETKLDLKAKKSGSYFIDGEINSNDESVKIGLEGTYGLDVQNEILNYGLKLKEISAEDVNLLEKGIDLTLAINSDVLGIYSKEIYSKYITMKDDSFKQIFNSLKENEDSLVLVEEVVNSIKKGISSMSKKQNIKAIEYNNKKENLNVITIEFTKNNIKTFAKESLTYLKNSDKFLEEASKLNSTSKEEIKTSLDETIKSIDESEIEDTNIVLEIGTSLIKGDFKVIKLFNTKEEGTIELIKIKDGIKFITDIDNSKMTLELTNKKTNSDKTIDNNSKLILSVDNDGEKSNMTLDIVVKEDKEPNVSKIDMKNAISYDNLTDSEMEKIYNNLSNLGLSSINGIVSSKQDTAELNALTYIDATEKEIVISLMKDSTINYNRKYKLDTTNTLLLKGVILSTDKGNAPTLTLDIEGTKPDAEINSGLVVENNSVKEAKLKYGEYYFLYKYDKLTDDYIYCSQTNTYPVSCPQN